MASLLKSTLNTRFLPGSGERFIRSDAPVNLTEKEIGWLEEQNIRTLVDLRSEEEAERKPCPLKDRKGFVYHHLPVTGGGDTPKSREHLHQVYAGMVDGQMEKIIRTILEAETKVLYFCTAGKDRTGVVSALLMKKLGADEGTIVQDYMLSKGNLMDMLLSYASAHPQVDPDIIIPREENILNVLASVAIMGMMLFVPIMSVVYTLIDEAVNARLPGAIDNLFAAQTPAAPENVPPAETEEARKSAEASEREAAKQVKKEAPCKKPYGNK